MAVEPDGECKAPEKLFKIKSKLSSGEDLALLPQDRIVVADRSAGAIKIFDSEGQFVQTLVSGVRPYGVTANRSGLIAFTHVRGKQEHRVEVCTQDGQKLFKWGDENVGWRPWGIATTSRGQLVVTDINPYTHAVGVYTNDGRSVLKFGEKGHDKNQFSHPEYVAVDVMDRILVSDNGNHCVKVFDSQGRHLFLIGGRGSSNGLLQWPRGVAADAQGNIMICDTGNKRISVFSPDGRFIQHLMTVKDGLVHPFGMDYNRAGTLVISNHGSTKGSNFKKIRAYRVI